MRNRKNVLLLIFTVAALSFVSTVQAAPQDVSGYAWSDNIGWIDFNPSNGFGGVTLDYSTGIISGYAWSDNIGWINFSPASNYPISPSHGVQIEGDNITGWARATVAEGRTDGWDGWIQMSGTWTNGVKIDKTTGNFSGYAWGSDVVGWISFDSKNSTTCTSDNCRVFTNPIVSPIASAPTVSLSASPNPVDYNSSATLSWSSTDATSCTASGDWSGSKSTSGSESTGNLTSAKTYTLTCTGDGGSASRSVTVNVNSASSPSCSLSADPSSGNSPLDVTLTATGSGGSGSEYEYRFDYTNDGVYDTSYSSSNVGSYTYTSGDYGALAQIRDSNDNTGTCEAGVIVSEPETLSVSLSANPTSGAAPLNSILTASVSGTAQGTINYTFYCDRSDSGTDITQPWDAKYDGVSEETKTYTCNYSANGSYSAKVIVERGSATAVEDRTIITVSSTPAPTVSLSASPNPVDYNSSATLSWSSTDATSCTASGDWSGSKSTSGSESTGNLTSAKTYTLTCTGDGGSASRSVTVNVGPIPDDFSLNNSNAIFVSLIGDAPSASTETTISVVPQNAFAGNVSLSVESISPALSGATFNFSDPFLSSSEYSTGSIFSVNVPSGASSGLYNITVRGDGGGLIRTINVQLNTETIDSSWIEI